MARARNTEKDFWPRVDVRGETECWLWKSTRWRRPGGQLSYGVFAIGWRQVGAHRMAWTFARGPIRRGLWVLHKCDNPPCCNPAHLFLGTPRRNVLDMVAKDRHVRGERQHAAKLTDDDVATIRVLRRCGTGTKELAGLYGVTKRCIRYVVYGKAWRHLGIGEKGNARV